MRKKILLIALTILLLSAGTLLISRASRYHSGYVTIDGRHYPQGSSFLDLSGGPVGQLEKLTDFPNLARLNLRRTGLTAQQYADLRAALPDCEIQWSPLFQGRYYADNITTITLTELKAEEIPLLDHFPLLSTVNAAGCRDYATLLQLQRHRPDCTVFYDVSLGGQEWDQSAENLVLTDADTSSILQQLAYLPAVKNVLLTGALPTLQDLALLQETYPHIDFQWQVEIGGVTADASVTELDLSGIAIDSPETVEAVLPWLPNLERVIMSGCGISNEEMDALNRRHETIQFIWTVDIGPYLKLRTDTTAFIPIKHNIWVTDADLVNLRYCTEMVCLDLGHHDITRCDFLAYMPKLKYLVLADTPLADISPITACKELIFLELFLTRVSDYTPLLELTKLEDLNLCYTHGQKEVLMEMTWLKRLWWSPSAGKQPDLSRALPDTLINVTTGSSTGGVWRKGQNYYDMRDLLGMYYMTG